MQFTFSNKWIYLPGVLVLEILLGIVVDCAVLVVGVGLGLRGRVVVCRKVSPSKNDKMEKDVWISSITIHF